MSEAFTYFANYAGQLQSVATSFPSQNSDNWYCFELNVKCLTKVAEPVEGHRGGRPLPTSCEVASTATPAEPIDGGSMVPLSTEESGIVGGTEFFSGEYT